MPVIAHRSRSGRGNRQRSDKSIHADRHLDLPNGSSFGQRDITAESNIILSPCVAAGIANDSTKSDVWSHVVVNNLLGTLVARPDVFKDCTGTGLNCLFRSVSKFYCHFEFLLFKICPSWTKEGAARVEQPLNELGHVDNAGIINAEQKLLISSSISAASAEAKLTAAVRVLHDISRPGNRGQILFERSGLSLIVGQNRSSLGTLTCRKAKGLVSILLSGKLILQSPKLSFIVLLHTVHLQ
jgi:hypothetical protein